MINLSMYPKKEWILFLSTKRIKLWTFQKTIKPGRKSQVLVPWELSQSGPVLARSRPGEEEGEEENCRLNKAGTKTREKREVGCWPREFLVGSCDTSQVREKTCGGWQGKLLTTTHIFSSLLFFSFLFCFPFSTPPKLFMNGPNRLIHSLALTEP
jgi:hypothetical protein